MSEAGSHEQNIRRKPERETRIPGLVPDGTCPQARGLSEGTRRKLDTDDRADLKGFAMAAQLRRDKTVLLFGLPHHAAQPTLVVKMSDTSHHGNSGFESRL